MLSAAEQLQEALAELHALEEARTRGENVRKERAEVLERVAWARSQYARWSALGR